MFCVFKTSERGHQSMSASDKSEINENSKKNYSELKKRKGETNEQRSIGEPENNRKVEKLKTVDGVAESSQDSNEIEHDEYQHIHDVQDNYKLTLDNATEKQSKQINHEDESIEDENLEDMVMEVEDDEQLSELNITDFDEIEKKSGEKKEKNKEKSGEGLSNEVFDIGGEEIKTKNVLRRAETSAHFQKHIVMDKSFVEDLSTQQVNYLRKKYIEELTSNKNVSIRY